jgi:hypothetical protein
MEGWSDSRPGRALRIGGNPDVRCGRPDANTQEALVCGDRQFARRRFEDDVDRVVAIIDELFESFHQGQQFAAPVRRSDEDLEMVGADSADAHRIVRPRVRLGCSRFRWQRTNALMKGTREWSLVGWEGSHGGQPFDVIGCVAGDGVARNRSPCHQGRAGDGTFASVEIPMSLRVSGGPPDRSAVVVSKR